MTFLPVPRQPALFKCWAVQPIELHTPILYIPLQPPPALSLVHPTPFLPLGLSHLPHVHSSRLVMKMCMAAACMGKDHSVV